MIIMGPGSWAGLAIGVVVCAIFAVVIIKLSKKTKAKTDEILAQIPEEKKNELRNQTYTEADGKNMYTSNGLVVSVDEEGDKAKVMLMFYSSEHDEFYTRNIKLTKSEVESKGISANSFVPALMKYDKDMHYYDFKKIL
ncbi:MAG: hypothetical protein K6G47_13955 [Clostridia bacterium]|nr:hypothetical protein [Clostridia bacterium]